MTKCYGKGLVMMVLADQGAEVRERERICTPASLINFLSSVTLSGERAALRLDRGDANAAQREGDRLGPVGASWRCRRA